MPCRILLMRDKCRTEMRQFAPSPPHAPFKSNSLEICSVLGNLFRQPPYISSSGEIRRKVKTRGRWNAGSGRSSVRATAVQESSRIYGDSHSDAGAGHWRDNRDLYAGARGATEVAAGGQTGRAGADWQ